MDPAAVVLGPDDDTDSIDSYELSNAQQSCVPATALV